MKKAIPDTNVIVGFLVGRDDYLSESLKVYDELFFPTEVFAEVIFVLESEYGIAKQDIFEQLGKLLSIKNFKYERLLLLNSLFRYRGSDLDIIDCLVLERAESDKCSVLTADKK